MKIKARKKEYDIKPGDYIQYNGVSYIFCTGDNRVLYYNNWTAMRYVELSKSTLKKIDFDSMDKKDLVINGTKVVRWIFN